ncbi:Beta-ketoacyl synthase [Metarhizium rileyi]|uniref:Beta-ketoacyl synthase n=1 Tax=Metarhizium rileyi (strain RCEF 4871) TaxID=1649241 RepID=A0A167B7U6_METRR|nr:Beta-ketoacyl synthase [Metarhizium rileyi RCEF 4871]
MAEPIAIIGSACRLAGDVDSPSELWKLLQNPRDVRVEIPERRFNAKGYYHPDGDHPGSSNVLHSYLINHDLSHFDAEFFGINPIEAKSMDPQQRLLLEVVYEALEASGISMASVKGTNTGVYVGVMSTDYQSIMQRDYQQIPRYFATGTGRSMLSNRISYFFDWHGPSITLDTACSSSLVAVHIAIQGLRSGETPLTVVCGTNLIIGPENYIVESKLNMLSPDGIGKMWDQEANGYARGDAITAVILKPLSAALENGDHIESVIRETGVNQDGATTGITMPSAAQQEALIRSTYRKAGLSPTIDRPHFFEAHGTGTPAGDPVEAQAIQQTFIEKGSTGLVSEAPLFVGSIKTVLGHTEGAAGIAALLKASLAVQHSCIPPNLHLNQISQRVKPFYAGLEIPQFARKWPGCPTNQPRRVSVNSFGFGGTNAHAIIESFQEGPLQPDSVSRDPGPFAPILFSAASERSLRATLAAYEAFLGENANLDIHNLAWTLRERRSLLPYRASFAATSTEELRDKIAVKIQDKDVTVGTRHGKGANKLLGIFTGQGAQYVGLGAEYLARSAAAQKIMQQLDASLARLPEPDRPAWSLEEEILQSSPRVHEPLIAQPLCTAIQIMMTDILQLAGVTFDTVVGHSSGEIGAAYAAGRLTATDAIRVAYYRGLHASLSSDPSKTKIKGAMIAVGTSAEDAAQLCEMDEFSGRISIAAYNSSNSVTISGDEDAISELEVILDDEKKFNRRLRVDKAYHSRHMLPSVEPYLKSLRACGIQVLPFSDRCKWFSSVHNSIVDGSYHLDLDGAYWAENMIRPVLFSQALSSAISVSKPDLVCEIGPHPALKGPASQTIQEVLKTSVPYVGTFDRESNPVEAMSCALGHLWSYLGSQVKLNDYERSMYEVAPECRLIKELPRYQWDHTASHWHESRGSRVLRQNRRPVHPLLGHVCPDSTKSHVTWKNLLRLNDLEWLEGHRVQGQVVFPASAYICSALEAARLLAEDEQIRLVEVRDVVIHQALAFAENGDGIEVLVSLEHISRVRPDRIRAHFSYSAAVDYRVDELSLAASGEIELYLGTPSTDLLPERPMTPPCMISVEHERFYDFLNGIGYNFTGRFRSLGTLRRKHRMSTCVVESQARGEEYSDFFIHPAELDACFQSIIVAYSYPKDDQLTSLHLPTRIGCVRLNPALCSHDRAVNDGSSFATCHASVVPSDCQAQNMGIAGSVDAYLYEANRAAMQVQNVRLVPLLGSQDDSEKKMFSGIQWIPCNPDGFLAASEHSVGEKHYDTMRTLDRISAFYLRQFTNSVPWDSSLRTEYPLCRYLEFSQHITSLVSSGKHAWLKQQWERDTLEDVMKAGAHLSDTIDMKIIRLVGEQMPRVFRGETTMLQQFRETGVLDDYYTHGFGFRESSRWMSRIVRQIAERYPHMNILEAGAGTGGATKDIIREIDKSFLTYTFTDISPAFFETAMESFSSHGERMSFKVLDIERDVVEQGYIEGGYDLVVASFVIHATAEIHRTLRNIRKLLKPGGFLVVGEGVHSGHNRVTGGFIFGSLPGWWLGVDDGRALSPLVETAEWNETLQHCGFSGIEARPPDSFEDIMGVSLFVSQALDDRVRLLRQPLSAPATTVFQKLFVIGGASRQSFSLVHQLCAILGRRAANTYHFTSLSDGDYSLMDFDSSVISLTELDGCFFDNPTPAAFANFTKLFEDERTILWITSGRLDHQPFSNMTVGFARTAVNEERNLRVQCLDVPDPETVQPQTIAQAALRLQLYQNSTDKQRVDMLWNVESEVLIDATGQCLIPRIRYLAMPNHRYNSTRSPRTRQVDTHGATVVLQKIEDEFVLKQGEVQPAGGGSVEDVRLRTLYAVVCSLKTAIGFKFLVMGVDVETGADYVTLTPVLSSCLAVSKEALIPWQRGESSIGDSLTLLAAHLVSKPIVDSLFQGQSLLVHNPTTYLSHALSSQALDKGVKLTVTTDLVSADIPNSWLRLPPFLTQCQFTETKLQNSSCFLGLSDSRSVGNQNESMILSSLPCHCVKVMAKDIFATASCQDGVFEPELIRETLRAAIELLQNHQPKAGSLHHVEPVCIRNFVDGSWPGDPMAIIDWTLTSRLPVRFERLDCRPMFEAQRTYWMVGLSGPLGISLCDWAITQGATHIVLTSRRPKIDPNWVQGHERRGVCVTIMPW